VADHVQHAVGDVANVDEVAFEIFLENDEVAVLRGTVESALDTLQLPAGRREDVGEILTRANSVLAEDVGQERFITLFLARLNPGARSFSYESSGHPSGYVMGAKGEIKVTLPRTGVPLGIRPDTTYTSSQEIQLVPGDLVLLSTDGIEETMAPDSTIFGRSSGARVARCSVICARTTSAIARVSFLSTSSDCVLSRPSMQTTPFCVAARHDREPSRKTASD